MYGGTDNDALYVDMPRMFPWEYAGEGPEDVVWASARAYRASSEIEQLSST